MQDIASVRIESARADVTNWRIIDRTSGADLTPHIERIDMMLTQEEGIMACLHFKKGGTLESALVYDPEIALTARVARREVKSHETHTWQTLA